MTANAAFPVLLSLRVAALAIVSVAPVAVGLAFLQARVRYPMRRIVDALILMPLVLPPSVVGFFLVVCFGTESFAGRVMGALGIRVIFTPTAAVIASALVALPIVVKTVQPSIEAVPVELESVARTLGLSPLAVALRVTAPMAWRGLVAALVLGFARAMGEFGATLMFAGNIPGHTNTMPVEIFAAYERGDDALATLYVVVLTAIAFAVVLAGGHLATRVTP